MQTAALLSALLVMAAQLHAPAVIPRDHGAVVTSTAKGVPRWNAEWTMEPWTDGGRKAVRFTEKGRGTYSPFSQEVQWTLESVWLADGNYFPLHFEKTIRDMQNRVLAVETKTFDSSSGKATYEYRNEKGERNTSSFAAARDVLTIEGIAGILQSFPFGQSGTAGSVTAHLLTNEPKLYDISIESRGTEKLTTKTGEVECFKIELVPHLGLLNVFKVFVPKTYFWFSVDAHHEWVRYQGLENGLGTPEIVMEVR